MSKRHASLNVRLNVDAQLLFYNNSWILKTVPDPFVASSSFMNLASNFAWILSNKRICPSHFPLKFVVVFVWKITTVNHTAIRFNMPQTDPHPDQLHVKGSEFFFLRSLPKQKFLRREDKRSKRSLFKHSLQWYILTTSWTRAMKQKLP